MRFFKKNLEIVAAASGRALPLSAVPDEAFASGILGVGVAIEPTSEKIVSPVSGRIENVSETAHAYSIHSDDGLDVLVHVGIDTVRLGGEGFFPAVKSGDRVAAGDPLVQVDLALLRQRGLPTVTPLLITNPERLSRHELLLGDTVGGKTAVMRYRIG